LPDSHPPDLGVTDVLLLGGRSGAGKTSVGWEISAQLQATRVAHCLIDGDNLDQAFPAPPGDLDRARLTAANLAVIWGNYAALGYRRLIYTNTVSVLEPGLITGAIGGPTRVTAVLLTAGDSTARHRLTAREIGSQLDAHLHRSTVMARHLAEAADPSVIRIRTDARHITGIARQIIALTGWATEPPPGPGPWLEY